MDNKIAIHVSAMLMLVFGLTFLNHYAPWILECMGAFFAGMLTHKLVEKLTDVLPKR